MRRLMLNILMGLLLFAAPLSAQTYEVTDPAPFKERGVGKEWGIGAVFIIGCLVVAFKPAKRANLR